MATTYWLGTKSLAAQVSSGTITGYDVATTYTVTVGGVAISQVGTGGTSNTTAIALVALLNSTTPGTAGVSPYFSAVTWTAPGGGVITGTADVSGVPFTAVLSVSGGAGTRTDFSTTTANSGPNDWSGAANWSGGSVPTNGDTVIIANSSVNICWGLDQSAIALAELRISQTYTGKIGLDYTQFAITANGETYSTETKPDYRADYLKIGTAILTVGSYDGAGVPNGSQRLKIDLGSATACTGEIRQTAASSSETGRQAVRLKAANASTIIYARAGVGGVCIAGEKPGETSTVGTVEVSEQGGTTARVVVGKGTTITTWYQTGGNCVLNAAGTVTTATCWGGLLRIEGDYTITTLNVNGGTVTDNHFKTAGNAITTANVNAGTLDGTASGQARTWATVNLNDGATMKRDSSVVTITTPVIGTGIRTVKVS